MAAPDELDDIRLLIELLDQEDLLEIEVEADGRRVLVRSDAAVTADLRAAAAEEPPLDIAAPAPEIEPTPEEEPIPENWVAVRSPMAGVFYRAAAPDAPPYVTEGDAVEEGDVLALVEAMKVFNPIVAELVGKVARIVAKNEEQVEAEAVLFLIEPL
jgi:acetyl-CoA carboxylase biotin carboxyl carrier protein